MIERKNNGRRSLISNDPPVYPPNEKRHLSKNWSLPGIEPGSTAWNAVAYTTQPQRPCEYRRIPVKSPVSQPFDYCAQLIHGAGVRPEQAANTKAGSQ